MRCAAAALALGLLLAPLAATAELPEAAQSHVTWSDPLPDLLPQVDMLGAAALSLPLATLLGVVLAYRPRRPATPARVPTVIQTQILLAVVGALVMLVVGASLARAFGIVGAASLIRYRVKVDDAKDAGVMLTTLGIGLASGVGLYLLAVFATLFVLGLLFWLESIEPKAMNRFHLKVTAPNHARLKPGVERLLRRHGAAYELRTASAEELTYEVQLPIDRHTDAVSSGILALAGAKSSAVEWEEKKPR
jgi:hypothetical protein